MLSPCSPRRSITAACAAAVTVEPPPPVVASPGSRSPSELEEALASRSSSSSPSLAQPSPRGACALGKRRRRTEQHHPCRGAPPRLTSPLARSCAVMSNHIASPRGARPPPIATVSSFEPADIDFGRNSNRGLNTGWSGTWLTGISTGSTVTSSAVAATAAPAPAPAMSGAATLLPLAPGPPSSGTPSSGVRSRSGVPSMTLITPGLWVGDEHAAASLSRLKARGITHVLNCTDQPSPLAGALGAPMHRMLGLLDSTQDAPHLPHALKVGVEFIHSAVQSGGTVLVHCQRGISRSCTLAMAYLIWAHQRPAEDVFEELRQLRHCCDPNLSYWCALKEWESAVLPVHRRSVSTLPSPCAVTGVSTASAATTGPSPGMDGAGTSAGTDAGTSAGGTSELGLDLAVSTPTARALVVLGPPSSRSPSSVSLASVGAGAHGADAHGAPHLGQSSRSPVPAGRRTRGFGGLSPFRSSSPGHTCR
jgi:predicted protein tyrosine phosphatase